MSHLDEGTLHALLDGELELHEVREIQAHLGSCTACDTRLQAAKDVYGEADRLVASVQFPGSPRIPAAAGQPAEQPVGSASEMRSASEMHSASEMSPEQAPPIKRERRIQERPVYEEDVPQVVILPEENLWPERRRRILLAGKWAAVLVVAIGAGVLASEVRQNAAAPVVRLDQASDAVVSPEETTGPEGGVPEAAVAGAAGQDSAEPPAAEPQSRQPPAQERYARKAATPPPPARQPEAPPPEDEAANLADAPEAMAGSADSGAEEEPPQRVEAASAEDVREEAAEALAELDRQRRRERAAAATAELDLARRQAEAVRAAAAQPPPAPAPRTLEQRSAIYLRIGLDEAARQLGRPVHVIEGLNAQFMGLVRGQQAPGADGSRPVVRVVYQDSQGRMILLDQQRVRPGQSWPSGGLQWVIGEVGLHLHGEASPEVLRNLRPRVR